MKNVIYRLFVKYFLPKHRLVQDQMIKDISGELHRIEALFYTKDLKPIYIVSDRNGKIKSFPENVIELVND
jgi:hypothetical protein